LVVKSEKGREGERERERVLLRRVESLRRTYACSIDFGLDFLCVG
jgi:hypothetical protein